LFKNCPENFNRYPDLRFNQLMVTATKNKFCGYLYSYLPDVLSSFTIQ